MTFWGLGLRAPWKKPLFSIKKVLQWLARAASLVHRPLDATKLGPVLVPLLTAAPRRLLLQLVTGGEFRTSGLDPLRSDVPAVAATQVMGGGHLRAQKA